jgi:hypothetical protein
MIWRWLAQDALATAVAVVAGHVVAWRPWRAYRRDMARISDLLDTGTPGGMSDLKAAMEHRTTCTSKAGK